MSGLTLIHLVSGQTMQNLLPILALRPARVIQVLSQGKHFEQAAQHIARAAKEAGVEAEFIDYPLEVPYPDMQHTRAAMKYWLPLYPRAVVNITGGTKLMSTGAFLGASEFTCPVLYCDTDRQEFITLGKQSLPPMPGFQDTARRLTLRTVMAAHGNSPDAWRFDTAAPAMLAFGQSAFNLRWQERSIFDAYQFGKKIRDFFRTDKGRIPSSNARLQALAQADILSALPDPVPAPVTAFMEAAAAAGILQRSGSILHIATPAPGANLRSHVERCANLLDGSWLELAVLQLVLQSPAFADAHWSVEPRISPQQPDAAAFGETDVVCLTLPQGALQVISCKTAVEKPLEHLESLRERATHLGGRFARASLALLLASDDQTRNLRRWGRLLGVEILTGDEIQHLAH